MKKIAVVYWSGTGNTAAMADAVAEGIQGAGGEAEKITAADFNESVAGNFDAYAFGCPSMGVEVLEESEFEPMWQSVKGSLGQKPVGLFGSYGWGDGEWMRNWEEDCKAGGLHMASDPVICNESPNEEARENCRELGEALVN